MIRRHSEAPAGLLLLGLTLGAATPAAAVEYRTPGTAVLETCRGIGSLAICSSESVPVPRFVDTAQPSWRGLHEIEEDGQTFCSFGTERIGYITTMRFRISCKRISR